jgi:hypothetical protein
MNRLPGGSVCLILAALVFSGCTRSSDTNRVSDAGPLPDALTIKLVDISDCKESPTGIPRVVASSSQDCVEWWYVGESSLHLRHVNAGFNCCPVVDVDIRVEGETITVEEIELEGNCWCLCLFDVEYVIEDLSPGVYQLTFVEPYRPQSDPVLQTTLDLEAASSGRFCVPRSQYPWGS